MNAGAPEEIIASRILHFVDEQGTRRNVSVLVGKPQLAEDEPEYHCTFQIIGIGNQQAQVASGRDSIHALQTAMILIAANLNHLNTTMGNTLKWNCGNSGDLGFP